MLYTDGSYWDLNLAIDYFCYCVSITGDGVFFLLENGRYDVSNRRI